MSAWPIAPVGEVLTQDKEYIAAPEPRSYPKLSVKLYGRGVTLDAPADGATLKMARHQLAKAGQVILSEIWGKKGAIGFVPPEGEGALCTSHFFLFDVHRDRLEPKWLEYVFRANYLQDQLDAEAKGTTGYAAVRPAHLLKATIPLPPLAEQRRLVERIEAVAAKVAEAKRLREAATAEAESLSPSYLGTFFRCLSESHPTTTLGELCSAITDGPHKTPTYVPAGVPFVTVKNMVSGKLSFADLQFITPDDHREFTKRCKPERGDVLYSKDGATRGRPCYVDTDREFSIFVSVALIKPRRDLLDGRFLCHLLNSTLITDRMTDKSRGDMIPHIVLREIRDFPVPVLPLREQHRMTAFLDSFTSSANDLKSRQRDSAAELDALLPAVLDRAFRGEL